ncbi:hypothetical protein [Legionella hackeliae]|uniref:Uncharacterized protein n=1 Tax=Legionella hackeliae TaxID=449 RepID=A0A0A8US80_LEGHA|nr:hypothetical protein [Legionella hackeliae]CEK09952.1 protein of unknown function [Legionella hackeliae]
MSFPTGNPKKGLGNGRSINTYPIWIQKSFGDWTTYGGGGYVQNLAPNTKNFYFEGWVLKFLIKQVILLLVNKPH